jgi:hypothetical protein
VIVGNLYPLTVLHLAKLREKKNKCTEKQKEDANFSYCVTKRELSPAKSVTYSRPDDLECEDMRENQIETALLARSCFVCF